MYQSWQVPRNLEQHCIIHLFLKFYKFGTSDILFLTEITVYHYGLVYIMSVESRTVDKLAFTVLIGAKVHEQYSDPEWVLRAPSNITSNEQHQA